VNHVCPLSSDGRYRFATSPAHYIDLALSIAADRSEIARKVDDCSPAIFDKVAGVRDLEAFLVGVIDAV
jgi:hypothetical protein